LIAKQRAIGGISAYYREQQLFTEDQIRMLSAFADQAAIAIENARLYEQARRGLVTKSALLLEMHHRVKNNLQTVAALLSLQQRRAKSPAVAQPLGESIARIQSIAVVHDLLSSEQVGQVTVGGLLKPIIEVATVNLVPPGKRIDFVVEGQSTILGSKEANVLALLLNELMANAIRHGFAERERGTITIVATDDGSQLRVTMRDDGAGLPSDFDLERDAGLGLQIVQTLARNDLRGRFDLRDDHGTVAEIAFSNTTIPLE
jgi:two-component sensor histidine kinase